MRLVVACALVTLAALAGSAKPAHACSCIPPDPKAFLARADGAFVGTLENRLDLGDGRALFTFRVERSVKGALGATVDVESASNGAACGLEASVGGRIGLFLARDGTRWTSSLCWQVDADDLLRAAARSPRVELVVGGRFGSARLLGLDRRGRTISRGVGRGTTTHLSVCPGQATRRRGRRVRVGVPRRDPRGREPSADPRAATSVPGSPPTCRPALRRQPGVKGGRLRSLVVL